MTTRRWTPKWALDEATEGYLPIPTRVVSNEEYAPLPQTPEQRRVADHLVRTARDHAARLGLSRRQFLGTSCGMAAAFLALNASFGRFYEVTPAEALEPAAARRPSSEQFIFDIQTHHVASPRRSPWVLALRRMGRQWNPDLGRDRGTMEDVYLGNYIKEVFLDSDTTVALISGIPAALEGEYLLPPGKMVETREIVNRLAASQRMVSHGLLAPNKGPEHLDDMARQVTDLKIDAWKGYTGRALGNPPRYWRVDDEKLAYPMLQAARRLGIKNICLHKGFPITGTPDEAWHPADIERAALDFPDLNFVVYHSGFKSLAGAVEHAREGFKTTTRVDWVSDLCDIRRRHPRLTNVYAELGSTFGMLAITSPLLCGHVLGMLIDAFGADHVLWGTDSIWWGSPQWQIEAFRRFVMPEPLMARFGYAPLTDAVKARILGLNAAALFGVDPALPRTGVPADFISRMRAAYREEGAVPSLTQYGWALEG